MSKSLSTKTFILSHLLILILGVGALVGLYLLVNPELGQLSLGRSGPVTTNPASFDLTITKPDDNIVNFDNSIIVSGKSSPFATIIISGPNDDRATTTDNEGQFSQVVNLSSGVNNLKITAYDSSGTSKTVGRMVYYSEEALP